MNTPVSKQGRALRRLQRHTPKRSASRLRLWHVSATYEWPGLLPAMSITLAHNPRTMPSRVGRETWDSMRHKPARMPKNMPMKMPAYGAPAEERGQAQMLEGYRRSTKPEQSKPRSRPASASPYPSTVALTRSRAQAWRSSSRRNPLNASPDWLGQSPELGQVSVGIAKRKKVQRHIDSCVVRVGAHAIRARPPQLRRHTQQRSFESSKVDEKRTLYATPCARPLCIAGRRRRRRVAGRWREGWTLCVG